MPAEFFTALYSMAFAVVLCTSLWAATRNSLS